MKTIKRLKYLITVIIIALLCIIGIYLKQRLSKEKYNNIIPEAKIPLSKEEVVIEPTKCMIDIKGAISKPGVYEIDCTNNINDAIKLAGGLTKEADTSLINLAKKVTNEMVIIIYTKEEVKNSNIVKTVIKTIEKECVCPNIQNDGCINNEINDTITNEDNSLININTATLELLQTLPGIGESKAKAIIKYREEHGSFTNIEDILNVEGIGNKLYEDIKIYITT